ncbi:MULTISPECIES: response regulator [Rhodomicrobium]|uniref:response regulator transcription factor n=1 Tax=Rhodomicrobium TaxID=1068 RepID=UPI000B4BB9F8|nr:MULTISPECIES: response regulator [Rhodomicrobium]
MTTAPPVYVIDDDARVREALTLLLAKSGIPSQPFEAAEPFLAALPLGKPVCGLVDVCLPAMSGLQLLKELKRRNSESALIMISGHGNIPMAVEAMQAGAVHFIEKPFDPEILLELVEDTRRRFVERDDDRAKTRLAWELFETLTAREREVMALIIEGLPNKLVAARLAISTRTAEHHRAAVMRKMNARTLSHLFRFAALLASDIGPDGHNAWSAVRKSVAV